uniref:Uncharacterized protein n=1 Tax=Setaria digitata TaxID=48799 RepID=A0A915PKU5_9BILA
MKETDKRSKLRRLDKLIVKAQRNPNPAATEVQLSITETDGHGISELEKKAREEILKETMLGVRRYEKIGPQGWKKPTCLRTDKKFLERVLRSVRPKSSVMND